MLFHAKATERRLSLFTVANMSFGAICTCSCMQRRESYRPTDTIAIWMYASNLPLESRKVFSRHGKLECYKCAWVCRAITRSTKVTFRIFNKTVSKTFHAQRLHEHSEWYLSNDANERISTTLLGTFKIQMILGRDNLQINNYCVLYNAIRICVMFQSSHSEAKHFWILLCGKVHRSNMYRYRVYVLFQILLEP